MPDPEGNSRVCARDGLLAGPLIRVPDDPRYFQTAGALFVVGCNRLRCNLCGGMVRQHIGFRDADGAHLHAREIYDTPDFSASPYMIADPDSRAYACGCSVVVIAKNTATPFPNGTWTCAGHPPVEPPENASPASFQSAIPNSQSAIPPVLPPITLEAANSFALMIMNSHIQGTINVLALTFVDGNGMVATPAKVSLGEGWPVLKLWTNQTTVNPIEVDFATVAGACVQLTDETLWTY